MMLLSSFTLPLPWAQVNFRCQKRQIILTSGTTSQFSLLPCPMSEAMSLKNDEHLKQEGLFFILLLVPTSARRIRKIYNLYIQRWRPFILIFVSSRLSSPIYWFTFLSRSRFQSPSLGAISHEGNFKRVVHVYSLSA